MKENKIISKVTLVGLACAALVGFSTQALAKDARQVTPTKYSLTCSSAGTTTTSVEKGHYLFQASGERTCLCTGATCSESTGMCIPSDAGIDVYLIEGSVSCWSAAGGGELELNKWHPVK